MSQRETARGAGSVSGQPTCIWVALVRTGDPLVLTEGAEVEDAADVLLELLSFGRDRKNHVNINTRACAVYCDILFYKIFADETGCFYALSPNPWDGVRKHCQCKNSPYYCRHSFTSLGNPVALGSRQTASV